MSLCVYAMRLTRPGHRVDSPLNGWPLYTSGERPGQYWQGFGSEDPQLLDWYADMHPAERRVSSSLGRLNPCRSLAQTRRVRSLSAFEAAKAWSQHHTSSLLLSACKVVRPSAVETLHGPANRRRYGFVRACLGRPRWGHRQSGQSRQQEWVGLVRDHPLCGDLDDLRGRSSLCPNHPHEEIQAGRR